MEAHKRLVQAWKRMRDRTWFKVARTIIGIVGGLLTFTGASGIDVLDWAVGVDWLDVAASGLFRTGLVVVGFGLMALAMLSGTRRSPVSQSAGVGNEQQEHRPPPTREDLERALLDAHWGDGRYRPSWEWNEEEQTVYLFLDRRDADQSQGFKVTVVGPTGAVADHQFAQAGPRIVDRYPSDFRTAPPLIPGPYVVTWRVAVMGDKGPEMVALPSETFIVPTVEDVYDDAGRKVGEERVTERRDAAPAPESIAAAADVPEPTIVAGSIDSPGAAHIDVGSGGDGQGSDHLGLDIGVREAARADARGRRQQFVHTLLVRNPGHAGHFYAHGWWVDDEGSRIDSGTHWRYVWGTRINGPEMVFMKQGKVTTLFICRTQVTNDGVLAWPTTPGVQSERQVDIPGRDPFEPPRTSLMVAVLRRGSDPHEHRAFGFEWGAETVEIHENAGLLEKVLRGGDRP